MRIELAPRIVADSEIAFGKPTIAGTRVPVTMLVGKLSSGMSVDEIVDEYDIEREDMLAALDYASLLISRKRLRRWRSR